MPSGKTLTITGTGTLRTSSKGFGAGIGGGYKIGTNKPIKDSRGRNAAWVFFAKYFVFYFFPLLLSIGLSLLVTVNTAFFSHLGVVLSIILSMLLALMSILTNYDYSIIENQKQKEKLKVVVKQTTNAIIFSCIIGILMLLIGFVVIAVSDKNISWIPIDLNLCKILLSVFTYYGLCVILLTLLLIIKNLTKIIAFNLAIERKEK